MKKAAQYKAMGSYGTIGIEIVLSVLLGGYVGTRLDRWLDTSPWMTVLWFGFGCAAAGRAVYRGWKDMQAATKREEAEEGNPEQQFPDETSLKWKHEEERERKKREGGEGEGEAKKGAEDGEAEKRDG